ncbi:MAG: CPBP family intramembrane metalloprotease [Gemmatimonadales bacterium]|nr:CPBP family intramembrane metalloprotease [Gemmatimonadales bacterium]
MSSYPDPVPLSRGRVAGHVGGFWVGYLVILTVCGLLKGFLPPRVAPLAWGGVSTLGLLGMTFWLLRREGRTAEMVGLRWSATSLRRFVAGLILGAGVYAIILLMTSLIAGPLDISRAVRPTGFALLTVVATTLALGAMEEVGFRAYPLLTLVESLGKWWGQLIVAVAFALTHVLYGWSFSTVALGVFPSALLFGAAAVATRGIACPFGVHVALNLCQWAMGEKGEPGVWHITLGNASEAKVAALAPTIAFIVVSVSAIAVLLGSAWHVRRTSETAA